MKATFPRFLVRLTVMSASVLLFNPVVWLVIWVERAIAQVPSNTQILLQRQGSLAPGDAILQQDRTFYDSYTFQGQAGQQITILLESSEFDTYLLLLDSNNNVIAQNDDASSNNTNSTLTVTLPRTETYTVLANSYDRSGRGQYSLTVSSPTQSVTTGSNIPSQPASGNQLTAAQNCGATLRAVQNQITQGRNIRVTFEGSDISEWYQSYPENRRRAYTLRLDGPAAESIMNSEQFMQEMSTNVIRNCDSVGMVRFNLNQTDWDVIFGLMNANQVQAFECMEPDGTDRKIPWGYYTCL